MKKTIPCRLAMFGTALILSTLTAFPALAANHSGHLDAVSASSISGWAWDSEAPDTAVSVELTVVGEGNTPASTTVFTVSADQSRDDLQAAIGSAAHGFVYSIDWSTFADGTYTVTAAAVSGETKTPLIGTIAYTKENTPAPAVPEAVAQATEAVSQTPEAVSKATETVAQPPATQPVGPGQSTTGTKGTSSLTPEQVAMGPGYMNGPSSKKGNTKTPYGPGAASYETGEADQYLGSFHATAYCGCDRCSGGHALTYSGTVPRPNHTIAADLNLYPIGTKLLIDGIVYTVEDRGSSVVDNRIDIFFATHEEALAFGLKNVDVYSVK